MSRLPTVRARLSPNQHQHVGRLDTDADHARQQQHHGFGLFAGACVK
jgi:hypothetical protein